MKTVMIIAGVTVGLVMTACELTPVMVAPQTEAAREQARQARVTAHLMHSAQKQQESAAQQSAVR